MELIVKVVSVLIIIIIISSGFLIFQNMKIEEEINNMMTGEIPSLDKGISDEVETATFSLGCFWGPDAKFGAMEGVIRTRVGYSGGSKEDPTYHNLGKHTETIQIDYDPDKISYEELLNIFWESHDPTQISSTQYMSRIFYHDGEQEQLAKESREEREDDIGKEIRTRISDFKKFYLAEDYHQKYYLKQHKEFAGIYKKLYPDKDDFLMSTAVSRANGYVVGDGYLESPEDLKGMGLSEEGRKAMFEDWMSAQDYSGKSCPGPYF